MTIAGFQSLSLIEYPGRVCSTLFTQGCPFRCSYCHNPELIPYKNHNQKNSDEILSHLLSRKHLVDAVCVTGGEPTVHPDLPEFLAELKSCGFFVKLDTNGIFPRVIERILREKSVDYIAMDLKHIWGKYETVTRTRNPQVTTNCRETFKLIQSSGIDHEFRTTVYPALHTEADLLEIAASLRDGERYALQEIRYDKTLEPDLKRTAPLDLERIAKQIRFTYPSLTLLLRSV